MTTLDDATTSSGYELGGVPVDLPVGLAPDGLDGDDAGRPWPARLVEPAIVLAALIVNLWSLSINGWGNTYYAAAARSMTQSWSNFFFASFDPGGWVTVD